MSSQNTHPLAFGMSQLNKSADLVVGLSADGILSTYLDECVYIYAVKAIEVGKLPRELRQGISLITTHTQLRHTFSPLPI